MYVFAHWMSNSKNKVPVYRLTPTNIGYFCKYFLQSVFQQKIPLNNIILSNV